MSTHKNPAPVITEKNGVPVTTSKAVAEQFGKSHKNVIQKIDRLVSDLSKDPVTADFNRLNFKPITLPDAKGEPRPAYILTRDGFTLLAMGFTGSKAAQFKIAYINAFNAMEAMILERQTPIWQDTRTLCKEVRRRETDAIQRLVSHAQAQGSRNAFRYYSTLSTLADRTAGITDRDRSTTAQLTALVMVERIIEREINAGIEAGTEYKTIYDNIKTSLQDFAALTKAQ